MRIPMMLTNSASSVNSSPSSSASFAFRTPAKASTRSRGRANVAMTAEVASAKHRAQGGGLAACALFFNRDVLRRASQHGPGERTDAQLEVLEGPSTDPQLSEPGNEPG